MRNFLARTVMSVAAGLAAMLAAGCVFVADALNPNVLTSFGISPTSVSSGGGRMIIAFDNTTSQVASFTAVQVDSVTTPTVARESGRTNVPAGETANVVLDCPVPAVIPGRLGDQTATDIQIDDVAAIVDPNGAATEVSYTGAPLRASVDYRCGDVVVVTLSESGGTDNQFRITVRVIPGR